MPFRIEPDSHRLFLDSSGRVRGVLCVRHHGIPAGVCRRQRLRGCPFADESFVGVTSLQTLEHLSDRAAALGGMIRVLRPGSWLFVVGPSLISLLTSADVLLYSTAQRKRLR